VFIIGQQPPLFSHGLTLEREAVGVVHQTVEDGVSQGVVTDAGVPLVGGELADHQCRSTAMAVVHDLHQVVPVSRLQRLQSPVIDDQELDLGQLLELLVIAAVRLGLCQLQQQQGEAVIWIRTCD